VSFDEARAVADAVLFEGYALYPYRASAPKNQLRWQFGVLAPRGWSEAGGGDPWWQETECLIEPTTGAMRVEGRLRFLHLRRREPATERTADQPPAPAVVPWDEGEKQEIDFSLAHDPHAAIGGGGGEDGTITRSFELPGAADQEGTVIRRRWPLAGVVRLSIDPARADHPLVRLRVRVENLATGVPPGAPREQALRASLLGTHVLLSVAGGAFVSLLDPPDWAAAAAAGCRSTRTYPVLAGPPGRRDLVISAPLILYDHPAVAPESPGDLFDATEIDEILTLRILTLTDAEKSEMRATDPRLAALLDSVERLGPAEMARLHGATRELHPVSAASSRQEPATPAPPSSEEPAAPTSIEIAGHTIQKGSRVRLRPGARRTDAQDMFLAGMTATVEEVMRDVDDHDCLAVSIDDDPATEVLRWHGRFHYFYPDEVEPLVETRQPAAPP
jgi:hypothetical protein